MKPPSKSKIYELRICNDQHMCLGHYDHWQWASFKSEDQDSCHPPCLPPTIIASATFYRAGDYHYRHDQWSLINDDGATININISITMVSHPPTMPPSNSASDLPSAQVFHICPALNLTLDQIRKPFQRNETSFPIMYWDLHTTPLCKSSVYFYAEKSLWENPRSICCARSQG